MAALAYMPAAFRNSPSLKSAVPCSISARAASLTAPLALGLGAAAAASDVGELLWVGLLIALRGGMLLLGAAGR